MAIKKDKRVDAYIQQAQPYAQPILKHLRQVVHQACPDTQEKIKWGMPHFDYKDQMLCSMAAFKQHAVFGFWKASLLPDPNHLFADKQNTAMGSMGQLQSLKDLPSDVVLKSYIKAAMQLNDAGITVKGPRKTEKKVLRLPAYFKAALANNKKAQATYEAFSYSHKKEYIEWVTGAKTEETRQRRLAKAITMMADGKSQNWKYQS